ncbi:MAG: Rieske 2Fe-2S domain-containing protein [Thermoleophilia bacterium]|nr:Rieske 2Fe-2S domain-containing protein [Thermoleophilia bacterium]
MKALDIPAGQGAAGKVGTRPVAVYNTGKGLTVLENICTHMKCQTQWNSAERSWDCPCHGSRYHPEGGVLQGPAKRPLPALEYHLENDEIVLEE